MSSDGIYFMYYEGDYKFLDYDMKSLEEEYGGKHVKLNYNTIFYDKPKYTLCDDDFKKLHANQVFESINGDHYCLIYQKY